MSNLEAPHPSGTSTPPPLRGADQDSFARHTVAVRMPGILRRVIGDNPEFPADIRSSLAALLAELPHGAIQFVPDDGAPDVPDWEHYLAPYVGTSWLEVPWFLAETLFYRVVLARTGYFCPGTVTFGLDPFARQKRAGLRDARPVVRSLASLLSPDTNSSPAAVDALLIASLWGNQADLSVFPAGGGLQPTPGTLDRLLVNDAPRVAEYLSRLPRGQGRVDFVLDNMGADLIGDLVVADHLLTTGLAAQVFLWAKPHPTFVSDATARDVVETVAALMDYDVPAVASLGSRLQTHIVRSDLVLATDWYWTSSLSGWEMPDAVRRELSASRLLIFKGDANYRRLLGDRHWPLTHSFQDIVGYLPVPAVTLRVLKSEVAAGLSSDAVLGARSNDPSWMTSGKWALVQAANLPA